MSIGELHFIQCHSSGPCMLYIAVPGSVIPRVGERVNLPSAWNHPMMLVTDVSYIYGTGPFEGKLTHVNIYLKEDDR